MNWLPGDAFGPRVLFGFVCWALRVQRGGVSAGRCAVPAGSHNSGGQIEVGRQRQAWGNKLLLLGQCSMLAAQAELLAAIFALRAARATIEVAW